MYDFCLKVKTYLCSFAMLLLLGFEIPVLSQVGIDSQVVSVERAFTNYKQEQKFIELILVKPYTDW